MEKIRKWSTIFFRLGILMLIVVLIIGFRLLLGFSPSARSISYKEKLIIIKYTLIALGLIFFISGLILKSIYLELKFNSSTNNKLGKLAKVKKNITKFQKEHRR